MTAEQFGGARSADFGEMRADDRDRIKRECAGGVRRFTRLRRDNTRFETIDGLTRHLTGNRCKDFRRGNGEERSEPQRSFADYFVADPNRVRARIAREVVTEPHTGQHDADLGGE